MSDPSIPDDMVERVARALFAHVGVGAPDRLDWRWENWLEDADRDNYREKARQALEAALGGRVVVDLPEPDCWDQHSAVWRLTVDGNDTDFDAKLVDQNLGSGMRKVPVVETDFALWDPAELEAYCLAGLAAAREARRLAEEAQP